jgi:hypothetical protein
MRKRTRSKVYEYDGVEVNVICGRARMELWVFLNGSLDLSNGAQAEIEKHWRQCDRCGRGRGHDPVPGTGPNGLTLRIRPEDEEHWAEVLSAVLAKPGALVQHAVEKKGLP